MKLIFKLAAMTAILVAPAVAHAQSGYMTCQLYQSGKGRVVYTRPFAADSETVDATYTQFLASLKDQGYVSDFSDVSGTCNWERSESAAAKKGEAYKQAYVSQGANSVGVPFAPS